ARPRSASANESARIIGLQISSLVSDNFRADRMTFLVRRAISTPDSRVPRALRHLAPLALQPSIDPVRSVMLDTSAEPGGRSEGLLWNSVRLANRDGPRGP